MADGEVQSASRDPVEGPAALEALVGVRDLYVAKGKKVLHFDLSVARPSDDELLGLLLGRSGKLRAPTLRSGSRLLVGYNQEMMESVLMG